MKYYEVNNFYNLWNIKHEYAHGIIFFHCYKSKREIVLNNVSLLFSWIQINSWEQLCIVTKLQATLHANQGMEKWELSSYIDSRQ